MNIYLVLSIGYWGVFFLSAFRIIFIEHFDKVPRYLDKFTLIPSMTNFNTIQTSFYSLNFIAFVYSKNCSITICLDYPT